MKELKFYLGWIFSVQEKGVFVRVKIRCVLKMIYFHPYHWLLIKVIWTWLFLILLHYNIRHVSTWTFLVFFFVERTRPRYSLVSRRFSSSLKMFPRQPRVQLGLAPTCSCNGAEYSHIFLSVIRNRDKKTRSPAAVRYVVSKLGRPRLDIHSVIHFYTEPNFVRGYYFRKRESSLKEALDSHNDLLRLRPCILVVISNIIFPRWTFLSRNPFNFY